MLLALLASMMSGGGAAAAPKGGCPRCDAKPTDHPDNPKKRKGGAKMVSVYGAFRLPGV